MKKIIMTICSIIVISSIIFGIVYFRKNNKTNNELDAKYSEIKKELTMYNENANIEELKKEYSITGDTELYEIQTEYDGRKVLVIKANENYKVAFAGLIKKSKSDLNEALDIYENKHPKKNGIWIEPESRNKILNYLNNNLNSKYEITQEGYLTILEKKESQNDNKIDLLINGDKQYILGISGVSYYIDKLTGEVFDDIYEEMDKYQTYSYFEDENKMIIFITENKSKYLSNQEIYESIIELVK